MSRDSLMERPDMLDVDASHDVKELRYGFASLAVVPMTGSVH